MKSFLSSLDALDLTNVFVFLILSTGVLVWNAAVPLWALFIAINIGVIVSVPMLAWFAHERKPIWRLLHGFYSMVCIPIAFREMYYLVPAIHPVDYDTSLIMIDLAVFGVHPTRWLSQFSFPALTELLQLAYSSYYLLPLILTIDLYRKKRYQAFRIAFFMIMLGFYLSYIGYVAVPAVGPRFTLHEFRDINKDLPGVFLTKYLRAYTDAGENISPDMADAARNVQRDVFPSGHTLVTLLVIWFAWRYRARSKWFLTITGALLIIGTVYLRYHYVVDLFGGVLFALLTVLLGKAMMRGWQGVKPEKNRPVLKVGGE